MRLALKLSLKNILGSGLRTFLNVTVLSFSFVIIILLNGIMDGWDSQAKEDSINWEFGNGHLLNKNYDPLDSYTILDGHGPITKNMDGLTPILIHQASIYPQGRMMSILIKGADPLQKTTFLPLKKLAESDANLHAVIGKRMAESTKISIGDELLIRWRDKNGTYDATTIKVVDIFDSNVPGIDSGQIWMSIETLWEMTGLDNEATYFIADKSFKLKKTNSWNFKSQEELVQYIEDIVAQKKTGQSIIYGLLMCIALLAIFDTQVLSVFRRQKEIGTYIALGMTRSRVVRLFTIEGSLYSILALILGSIYGIPLFRYIAKVGFAVPPADQKMGIAIADKIFPIYGFKLVLGTMILVIISSTIVSFLPAKRIAKLNPVLALKGKQQ